LDEPADYDNYCAERIANGAFYAVLTILLLVGAWRLAVTIDKASQGWDLFWLPFEWIILQLTVAVLLMPFSMLGNWLIDNGHTGLWYAIFGGALIGSGYSWFLLLLGLFGMGEHGAFGIPFLNFLALGVSGMIAGVYAHRVWFPAGSDAA
jgi:hypothetical protein